MKTLSIILIALMGAAAGLTAFVTPVVQSSVDRPSTIPDSIWAMVENSCYDCHANNGNGFAKAALNFDRWDEYSPEKQLNKAQDMCKELAKGGMPPAKYRKNNPEAVPSEAEVNRVCSWVAQIEK